MSKISPQGYKYGNDPSSTNPFWEDPTKTSEYVKKASVSETTGDEVNTYTVSVTNQDDQTETTEIKTANPDHVYSQIQSVDRKIGSVTNNVNNIVPRVDQLDNDVQTLSDDVTRLNENKQDKLTFDTAPTAGSNNPVTSDGINTAIKSAGAAGSKVTASTAVKSIQSDGIHLSNDIVTSDGKVTGQDIVLPHYLTGNFVKVNNGIPRGAFVCQPLSHPLTLRETAKEVTNIKTGEIFLITFESEEMYPLILSLMNGLAGPWTMQINAIIKISSLVKKDEETTSIDASWGILPCFYTFHNTGIQIFVGLYNIYTDRGIFKMKNIDSASQAFRDMYAFTWTSSSANTSSAKSAKPSAKAEPIEETKPNLITSLNDPDIESEKEKYNVYYWNKVETE